MVDARKRLEARPFSFRSTKSGEVHIAHHHRVVTILRGAEAQKFLVKIANADERAQQLLLARVTGHYKHDN